MFNRGLIFACHKMSALIGLAGVAGLAFAHPSKLFESTWTGYDVGVYENGWKSQASVAGDIDGDGDLDIVTTNNDPLGRNLAVIKNDGTGAYGPPTMYVGTNASAGVALIDVEGDGDLDILRSETHQYGSGSTLSLFRNNGTGLFGSPAPIFGFSGPLGLSVADFDADGRSDVAVVNWGYFGSATTIAVLYGDAAGAFTRRVTIVGVYGMRNAKATDLNADGKPDLAVSVDAYDGTGAQARVLIALNTGTSFASPTILDAAPPQNWAGNGNSCLDVGDMDNDGKPDIVFSSARTYDGSTGAFYLLRNMGGGGFAPKQFISFHAPLTAGATSLKVADLNGDGWNDVVGNQFSDVASGQIYVMLRTSSGGYVPMVPYPAGRGPFDVDLADLDGNGAIDVLVTNYYSSEATVHLNSGNGILPMPKKFPAPPGGIRWVDFRDADNDGDLDAFASGSSYLAMLLNNGQGDYAPYINYNGQPGRSTGGGALQDVTGDGVPDMLFADWNGPNGVILYVRYRPGIGNGAFGAIVNTFVGGDNPTDLNAADLDHDGDIDIVESIAYENAYRIGLNDGFGGFVQSIVPLGNGPEQTVFGDFNRDGHIDVASCCYGPYGYAHEVKVSLGFGNGTFQPVQTYQVDDGPYDIASGDFNGDGILDLATCNRGYENDPQPSLSVLVGNANGTFQAEQRILHSAIDEPLAIRAEDLDGDGKIDLAVTQTSNDVAVLKGNGNATFERQVRIGVGINPYTFQYKDLTGDGIKDIGAVCQTLLYGSSEIVVLKAANVSAWPNAFTVQIGQLSSGNAQSLRSSDNDRLAIFGFNQVAQLEVRGTMNRTPKNSLSIRVESAAARSDLSQTVSAFNFVSNTFVVIDRRKAATTETAIDMSIDEQAENFVDGNGEVRLRVRWEPIRRPVYGRPWLHTIDEVRWTPN